MSMADYDNERCAFEKCPMGDDIIEISGPCKEQRGARCGAVAAFCMLRGQHEDMTDLDEDRPIVASFEIDHIPAGDPPEEIRQQWVNVTVPVRYPEDLADDLVKVNAEDAILSLLADGKLDAAVFFSELHLTHPIISMAFRSFEGRTKQFAESKNSLDFYGSRLDEATRRFLEEGAA